MADFVPGFEASAWAGIGAPKNTPAEIIEQLNREINAGLADPKLKARLADLGGMVFRGRLPISGSSSPKKPRSGARWSNFPALSRIDPRTPADVGKFHIIPFREAQSLTRAAEVIK